MLKDIIEERKKELQSDPWLTPMFDPTISEEEKRIAINTIIEQTAQIVAREVLRKVREGIDTLSGDHTLDCIKGRAENHQHCNRSIGSKDILTHLQSLEKELTK
jgi:hypothetical protein